MKMEEVIEHSIKNAITKIKLTKGVINPLAALDLYQILVELFDKDDINVRVVSTTFSVKREWWSWLTPFKKILHFRSGYVNVVNGVADRNEIDVAVPVKNATHQLFNIYPFVEDTTFQIHIHRDVNGTYYTFSHKLLFDICAAANCLLESDHKALDPNLNVVSNLIERCVGV